MADINDTIAENLGLVYGQLKRFELLGDQDAESAAYEALYNAIVSYNDASSTKFSTYAICVIANAIRMVLRARRNKKQINTVSYHEPIGDENEETFADVLSYGDTIDDVLLRNEMREDIYNAIMRVYNNLTTENAKRIFIMWYRSDFTATQRDIAEALNVSQPTVCRNLSIFKYKLKQELEDYL